MRKFCISKVLLLGKNGMLGQAIYERIKNHPPASRLRRAGELRIKNYTAWGKEELDITNKKSVQDKIQALNPSIVINATGYTNVDGAEAERGLAFAVNAEGVDNLADTCAAIDAALFHFSTDYIFDGTMPQGYKEEEEEHVGPLNVYGESKLEGERRIKIQMSKSKCQIKSKIQNPKYFIIRTSWLYGHGGKNFVDTLLTRAKDGQTEFKVVNDQFGKPTYTGDLAERVVWMVERLDELESWVYHCTNEVKLKGKRQKANLQGKSKKYAVGGISWYDFAREIFKEAHRLGIIKIAPKVIPCTTADFPRPARRPAYSALINTKLPPMRDWKQVLCEYLQQFY